jgi:hypothetical protein
MYGPAPPVHGNTIVTFYAPKKSAKILNIKENTGLSRLDRNPVLA